MIARRRRVNSGSENHQEQNYNNHHSGTTFVSGSPSSAPAVPLDAEMSCRERSSEFMSAVKLLQSRQGNGVHHQRQNHALRQRSEFTQKAKGVGRDLSNTFSKLEKLTILAKRKSLFDDKPIEIQELTYIIKQDITSLNKQIANLMSLARSQSSQNGRHLQSHSNTVVVSLQSKLASMSTDFKQVLDVRTENLKHQKSRREQFSQPVGATPVASTGFGDRSQSVLLQDEANHMNGSAQGSDFILNMDGQSVEKSKYQQQMQIIEEQDSYIQSRAETMQNIESTIVELGSIFQQFAHMVKEQEETVRRIDSNVEETQMNVEGAHSEILKYFQSVTSNRWLMIKIFGVIIVFFIFFVVFMA